jgi:hypothetical protein
LNKSIHENRPFFTEGTELFSKAIYFMQEGSASVLCSVIQPTKVLLPSEIVVKERAPSPIKIDQCHKDHPLEPEKE